MSDNKKSYYAVIPATVRYDRKLKANAKLLYGEITALCNEKGYCWASNSYFAKLYEVSNQAISSWIKSLQNSGYVNVEYERKEQHITKRKVSINIDRVSTDVDVGINKSLSGYQQKLKENTTSNTTSNKEETTIEDLINNQEPEIRDILYEFVEFRKEIKKPMSVRALKQAINKVSRLSASKQVECIRDSIINGWQGLFPDRVKDDQQKTYEIWE